MGKTKLYTESENSSAQPGIGFHKGQQRRRRPASPGRMYEEQPDVPPLGVLLRQIYQRFRRNWIALRFQANRYTFGMFRRQTALKFAGLIAAGYCLFFTNWEQWLTGQPFEVEPVSGIPMETGLQLESGDSGGKSMLWDGKNEAAPLSVYDLRDEQTQDYISRFGNIAILEMKKYGIPASISLAQGLVESRSGQSKLAKRNNNHFGMKCFSKKCKKGHCSNFSDDHHKDFFRIFNSPWESWRAHSQMLANGRYSRLKKYGRDYRKWAYGLKSIGYATDRTYAEKLIGMIERYDLYKYDR